MQASASILRLKNESKQDNVSIGNSNGASSSSQSGSNNMTSQNKATFTASTNSNPEWREIQTTINNENSTNTRTTDTIRKFGVPTRRRNKQTPPRPRSAGTAYHSAPVVTGNNSVASNASNELGNSVYNSSNVNSARSAPAATSSNTAYKNKIDDLTHTIIKTKPPMTYGGNHTRRTSNGSLGGKSTSSVETVDAVYPSEIFPCFSVKQETIDKMNTFAHSRLYSILLGFFTFVLLFGANLQDWFFPKSADLFFDILFLITIGLLLVDMIIRSYTSYTYFLFNIGKTKIVTTHFPPPGTGVVGGPGVIPSNSMAQSESMMDNEESSFHYNSTINASNPNPTSNSNNNANAKKFKRNFQIGSYMFWFDFFATLSLLFDVSLLFPMRLLSRHVCGTDTIKLHSHQNVLYYDYKATQPNANNSIQISFYICLTLIVRTMRIARFLKPGKVVKIIKETNWFFLQKRHRLHSKRTGDPVKDTADVVTDVLFGMFKDARSGFGFRNNRSGSADGGSPLTKEEAAIKIQRLVRDAFGFQQSRRRLIGQIPSNNNLCDSQNLLKGGSGRSDNERSSVTDKFKKLFKEHTKARRKQKKAVVVQRSARDRKKAGSQLGAAMNERTAKLVAFFVLAAILVSTIFTYYIKDESLRKTMITLYSFEVTVGQNNTNTNSAPIIRRAIDAAVKSSTPNMYKYTQINGTTWDVEGKDQGDLKKLRRREILEITVCELHHNENDNANHKHTGCGENDNQISGVFNMRDNVRNRAIMSIIFQVFYIMMWFFGVGAFSGPVSTLIVQPVENMVKLLDMLVDDPLGYQNKKEYQQFSLEQNMMAEKARWNKDILKGMETSFLMSTILRIGSLMKVGFGSAGVDIIRSNLHQNHGQNATFQLFQGSSTEVNCIFMFSDIRQFTDATECLQEEVFVFTNKIAEVVHSICNSYGGSANSNFGDAFLLSWLLESPLHASVLGTRILPRQHNILLASNNQAEKALLSAVKICLALEDDEFFLEGMSNAAKKRLVEKMTETRNKVWKNRNNLKERLGVSLGQYNVPYTGPIVQMGFGLHAGKAVQCAIGSRRKLDATYISTAVFTAERLETSTKTYGLKVLMSGEFYNLLSASNRRRCRKIDQVICKEEFRGDVEDTFEEQEIMHLYTFDMAIDDANNSTPEAKAGSLRTRAGLGTIKRSYSPNKSAFGGSSNLDTSKDAHDSDRGVLSVISRRQMSRRRSAIQAGGGSGDLESSRNGINEKSGREKFVPPKGLSEYNNDLWLKDDIRSIRKRFTEDAAFFKKFEEGLQCYVNKNWETAREHFKSIAEKYDDSPSLYFLEKMDKTGNIPPRLFNGYGSA